MRNKDIEIFLSTFEHRSLTGASKELYFSKQNMSKSIRNLENEIGVTLFKRDIKGMEPTEECLELYNILKNVEMDIKQLADYYKIKTNPCSVKIAANNFESIIYCFSNSLKIYYDKSVFYYYENNNSDKVLDMLINKECQIGVFTIPMELESRISKICEINNIAIKKLNITTPGIMVKKGHPLAKLEYVTPKDLKGYKRIALCREEEKNFTFDKYMITNDINPEADITTNVFSNILTYLEEIDCYFIGVYDEQNINFFEEVQMRPFKGDNIDILIYLAYRKDAVFDKATKYFMELVQKIYKGDCHEN